MAALDPTPGDARTATITQLWPAGTRRLTRAPLRRDVLLVLPNRRHPRLLVPADIPAAATMFRRHRRSNTRTAAQRLAESAHRAGLLTWLPFQRLAPAGSVVGGIGELIADHVPEAARVGVLLGPARANEKPVLRVFAADGRTVAFGKVGHTALSARLVRREAAVLAELSHLSFRQLRVPEVIHAGQWQGMDFLFLSPLPADGPRPGWEPPVGAMVELAESGPVQVAPVGDSWFVRHLQEQSGGLPATPLGNLARTLVAEAVTGAAPVELRFGRWHGDWAPWNMSVGPGWAHVWDWERSGVGVPLGADLIHWRVQQLLSRQSPSAADAAWLVEKAVQDLAQWYAPMRQIVVSVQLYLAAVLCRYAEDAPAHATTALQTRCRRLAGIFQRTVTSDWGRQPWR